MVVASVIWRQDAALHTLPAQMLHAETETLHAETLLRETLMSAAMRKLECHYSFECAGGAGAWAMTDAEI